jgi:hypothetical protein
MIKYQQVEGDLHALWVDWGCSDLEQLRGKENVSGRNAQPMVLYSVETLPVPLTRTKNLKGGDCRWHLSAGGIQSNEELFACLA